METHGVNPGAIEIMKEDGIDISNHTSNNIDEYRDIDFDFVITICDNAKERCPYFSAGAKKISSKLSRPGKSNRRRNQTTLQASERTDKRILQRICA